MPTLYIMLIGALVLLMCVTSSKLLYRFGVPSLLIFLCLGMLFGSDGPGGIAFDNFELAGQICSFGLIFIMFYGGFSTNWKAAKPVAAQAITMSTLGTILTAVLTGLFCYFALGVSLLEGLLIGSVVGSTDAASVFSILRSRKLNLKGGLASLLEVESGSNDPVAYMMTMIFLTLLSGEGQGMLGLMLFKQIIFGLALGFLIAKLSALVLKKVNLEIDGLYPIFTMAIAILSYAACEWIGGNGYLCVYIVGIMLGNSKILHKRSMVHFFDGISWLMQILLFFTLGLLSFPTKLPAVALSGTLLSLFMILVARPAATFGILSFFKVPFRQKLFVSWVGLRGAASIVFAIFAVNNNAVLREDLFHMVFFVALFSVAVQGTLIPGFAKKLKLVEDASPVLKTFNDYQEETGARLLEYRVKAGSRLAGKTIMDADIPQEILVVMIRRGPEMLVPKGNTLMLEGDVLVLSGSHPEKVKQLEKKEEKA